MGGRSRIAPEGGVDDGGLGCSQTPASAENEDSFGSWFFSHAYLELLWLPLAVSRRLFALEQVEEEVWGLERGRRLLQFEEASLETKKNQCQDDYASQEKGEAKNTPLQVPFQKPLTCEGAG